MEYLINFRDRIVPVIILPLIGFGLGRTGWIGLGWTSAVCLYLFSPAQIVSGMMRPDVAVAGGLYMICNSLFSNTLGIYMAARGKKGAPAALREMFASPILFDCRPRLLSSAVVLSTVVSMLTLAGVLSFLS